MTIVKKGEPDYHVYILAVWSQHDAYFAHKENIIYAATSIYATAVAYALITESLWKVPVPEQSVIIFVSIQLTAFVFNFVKWQLTNRRIAGIISESSQFLSHQWLTTPPSPNDLELIELETEGSPMRYPRAIAGKYVELNQVSKVSEFENKITVLFWILASLLTLRGLHSIFVSSL